MNKIDKFIALRDLDSLRKMIELIYPEPCPCSQCTHVAPGGRCSIPDPSMPIPEAVFPIGCINWKWDQIPF